MPDRTILTPELIPGHIFDEGEVGRTMFRETWRNMPAGSRYGSYIKLAVYWGDNPDEAFKRATALCSVLPLPGSLSGRAVGDRCWSYPPSMRSRQSSSLYVLHGSFFFESTALNVVSRLEEWAWPRF